MIQQGTYVTISDNSGARSAKCIKVLSGSFGRYATIGDKIVLSIKSLRSKRKAITKIKKGSIAYGLVVQTKQLCYKKNGNSTKFKNNLVVLLNAQNKPIGSRILQGIPQKIRYTKYMRLTTLAPGIIK